MEKVTVEYSGSNISLLHILCYDIVYRTIGTMIKRHTSLPQYHSKSKYKVQGDLLLGVVVRYGSSVL